MAGNEPQRAVRFAKELAAACAELLGDLLAAVILHGSLAFGGFRPARSDVDILVVVERSLSDGEIVALQKVAARFIANVPGGIDFRVVTRAVAASPTRAPAMELYVGLHARGAPEIEARVAGEPDLVAEFSMVRAGGRSLIGPEPRTVVGVVPDGWVVAYGDEHLARWQRLTDDAEHAEHMVLTTCRIWRFAAEAIHCSKTGAGRWALARDPSLTAVVAALRQRAGDPDARVEPADIAHLLALVRSEIAQYPAAPTY
jgi:predicted nucleotidyltransferase